MNLLFIHGNFPGQFLKLAPALARLTQGATLFLTESVNPQGIDLDGVTRVRFQAQQEPATGSHAYLESTQADVVRGQAVVRAIAELIRKGFRPDTVIVHGGRGYGLFIKDAFPQCRVVSYMEWFFTPETSRYFHADFNLDRRLMTRTRNWALIQELMVADEIVTPTAWQAAQFPAPWSARMHQIFDGVDTEFFAPPRQNVDGELCLTQEHSAEPACVPAGARLLTYATRGMEPLRGFPQFMRAAAAAMQHAPDLHVVVAGRDRIAYSYPPPDGAPSWKALMLEELSEELDHSRIHFPGLITYGQLRLLFHRSSLHCYFTQPFVMSWGLFQAAATGVPLLVNGTPPFADVFGQDCSAVTSVDLQDQAGINQAMQTALSTPQQGIVRRSQLREGLDLASSLQAWVALVFG